MNSIEQNLALLRDQVAKAEAVATDLAARSEALRKSADERAQDAQYGSGRTAQIEMEDARALQVEASKFKDQAEAIAAVVTVAKGVIQEICELQAEERTGHAAGGKAALPPEMSAVQATEGGSAYVDIGIISHLDAAEASAAARVAWKAGVPAAKCHIGEVVVLVIGQETKPGNAGPLVRERQTPHPMTPRQDSSKP